MRACTADATGRVMRDGVAIQWECYGDGAPTIMLLPTWSLVPSRHWKFQMAYLARRHRVVTFDGRGTGRSDSPRGVEPYEDAKFVADAVAVLDATDTDRAVVAGFSCGARWAIQLAAGHLDRVLGAVAICPAVPLTPPLPERQGIPFDEPLDTGEAWAKYNSYYWRHHYRDFVEFFAGRMVTEPHSTKQVEDIIRWGMRTDPVVLADATRAGRCGSSDDFGDTCARVRCPVLVIHGDHDATRPYAQGLALAHATGGELVTVAGGGHAPSLRDPVVVNRLIERFVTTLRPRPPTSDAQVRP